MFEIFNYLDEILIGFLLLIIVYICILKLYDVDSTILFLDYPMNQDLVLIDG